MADYSSQDFLNESLNLDSNNLKLAIVTALWKSEVTQKLKQGAKSCLINQGINPENIVEWDVPGSFELSYAANAMASKSEIDAVICLGVVIQGETRHFDFICNAVANGITNASISNNKPIAFGVLTTDNQEQALERSGGKHGNKGHEAAWTVLKLLERRD